MASYKVTDTEMISLADAIRAKGGTSTSLAFPDGFISAIDSISSGGVIPSGTKEITQNGVYDVASYASANVDVSGGGGSNDNFLIACGVMSGSIYDTEAVSLGSYMFLLNSRITGAEMTSVQTVGDEAFKSCYNISTASFPNCISIGSQAFQQCYKLQEIYSPHCEHTGSYAFGQCSMLSTVSFPECSYFGSNAFSNCRSLTVLPFNPSVVEFLGDYMLDASNPFRSSLTSITLEKCTFLGSGVFTSCVNLLKANLPLVSQIRDDVFSGCSALKEVYAPACNSIINRTFQRCTALESVYLLSTSFCLLYNSQVFDSTPMKDSSYLGRYGSIYVPSSMVESYKTMNHWSYISDRITSYVE